jgi:ribosome maturation factor RimP
VNIDQCEAVSRPLSDALDEADPIEGSYVLEVSSAGADRPLKKPEHFAAYLGQEVEVKLYRPKDGSKSFHGELLGYENGDVTLKVAGEAVTFLKKELALTRLYVTF